MDDWTFKNFAKDFDAHVREQLPWYDMVTEAVTYIAKHYIPTNGLVYDIGCSTGNITAKLLPTLKERYANVVGIDVEDSMIRAYDERFSDEPLVDFRLECAESFEYKEFDVAIVFLTMMFMSSKDQESFIANLYETMNKGGCIILVDKVNDTSGYMSTILKRMAMHFKLLNGADAKEVIEKEMSLVGVQRPINQKCFMIHKVTQFFQMGEFKGWVIEK